MQMNGLNNEDEPHRITQMSAHAFCKREEQTCYSVAGRGKVSLPQSALLAPDSIVQTAPS